MPLLEVEGLKIAVESDTRSLPIVDAVSFAVNAGQTLGIVGESGSGKSTLALSLIRLLPRNVGLVGGRIVFDGRDLGACSERELRAIRGAQIGFVFQDPMSSLNPTRRVGVQVAEVLVRHKGVTRREAFRRTEELFESVKIARAKDRVRAYPYELSGGMCQRVTIAMAMACSPKLLIADEPTTALDPTVEAQVLSLLDELKRDNSMAMILISHDLRVVSGVADDVAVMYAGEFVEYGSTDAVLKRSEHPYTEALLKSVPRLDDPAARHERLLTIAGALPKPGEWGAACRFAPRCPRFRDDDACATTHPELREVRPRHWARTAHPRHLLTTPGEPVSAGGSNLL
jgi:peptide/nickel transport system ATP-binding protein